MVSEKRGMFFVFVVLLSTLFSLSVFSVSVQGAGCILHPNNPEMYCIDNSGAQQEACADDPNCRAVPQACDVLSDCEYVECGTSEGCQFPFLRGLCPEPLTPEESEVRCFPGCCVIPASSSSSEPICEYGPDYYQCQQLAVNYLGPGAVGDFFSSDQVTCLNQCGVELAKSTLIVTVNNVLGEPLSANLKLSDPSGFTSSGSTNSLGQSTFSNLNAGIYEAQVSSSGYIDQTFSVSLSPGSLIERVITLLQPGIPGKVSGKVFYTEAGSSLPLGNAKVTISSTMSSAVFEVMTSTDGSYSQDLLPPGAYSVTASHPDQGSEQTLITLSEGEDLTGIDLILQGQIFQGVKGVVYLNSVPTPGAEIFLDGRYISLSRDAGYYQLSLPADSTVHTLRATYAGYYESEGTFMITPALPVVDLDLTLVQAEAVCSAGNWLPISGINYEFTPGEPDVTLSWTAPCPEVIGYQLSRTDPSGEVATTVFSALVTSYWDYGLEWGEIYTYTITALYASEARIYTSEEFSIDIQIGDEICRYYEEGESFCEVPDFSEEFSDLFSGSSSSGSSTELSEDPIFTCGPDNRYTQIDTCEEGFCASDRRGGTTCLRADVCSLGGRPFGLYYERDMCYYGEAGLSGSDTDGSAASGSATRGSAIVSLSGDSDSGSGTGSSSDSDSMPPPSQFCYYDYSSKNTIVDSCESCATIESCFDYLSKDACEFNSCLTSQCQWVDAADTTSESPLVDYSTIFRALDLREEDTEQVFSETGAGFCVQKEYNKDDQCFKCDTKNGNVFENYFCTPDVCTNLGRCFSNPLGYPGRNEPLLSFCATCGDHPTEESTCYMYTTELECVGNNSISSTNGVITLSDDNCNWGRCTWDGSSCVKDGNVDEESDCSETDERCKQDNTAPITSIVNGPVPQISLVSRIIEFEGDDSSHGFANQQNDLLAFGYCLISADSPEACTEFKTKDYSRRTGKEKMSLDVIEELAEELDGVIYKVSYYSEDEYFNRESAKSSLIYIDNVAPEFEINQTILVNEDRVKLKAWLANPSELMSCNFTLSRPGAVVSLQSYDVDFNEVKNVDFTELTNIVNAELNVTCNDLSGNRNSKIAAYTFDLEEKIEIINPLLGSAIAETGIVFEVKTTVDARCGLYQNNEPLTDFSWTSDTSRKEHKTDFLTGFTQREYFNEIKVICHPFAEIEDFEEYFHFTIDLTPPSTQIVLTEGVREYRPTERVWETAFVNSATVQFECSSEGFSCDKTYYCVGQENDLLACPPFPNENYKEFTTEGLVINSTSRICYYSTDMAGNTVFSANCGTVNILGFGIEFEFPTLYTFQGEDWVISPYPIFDWQFSTRVPTQECKYDFNPNFNYYELLDVQTILPNAQGKYLVSNFPQNVFKSYPNNGGVYEVYIRCLGLTGELSPEKKYIMEYDPNAPVISDAYADPDQIYEETRTNIFASTDRKTVCKYSDNSEGLGSSNFETMEYSFPGFLDNILYLDHEDIYSLNGFFSPDGKKDFILNAQCSTGAGLLSEVRPITFMVDYSSLGFISEMYAGTGGIYVYTTDVPLVVQTSKNSVCQYQLDNTYSLFTETGGKEHSTTLFNLDEGSYEIPVRCEMDGGHFAEGKISFIIDLTPPVISKVDDGNLTCGSPVINVIVQSNEQDISGYYYEVYSLGKVSLKYSGLSSFGSTVNSSQAQNNSLPSNGSSQNNLVRSISSSASSSSSVSPVQELLILNGSVLGNLPLVINLSLILHEEDSSGSSGSGSEDNLSLLHGKKYAVQVWATDGAGNQGLPKKSDGVIITTTDYPECTADNAPPKVNFILNTTCLNILASMDCEDQTGCKGLRYGVSLDEESCVSNKSLMNKVYDGSQIRLEKTSWICYAAEDNVGNKINGTKKVVFSDNDGDSIENSCDLCKETPPGKLAGPEGCSFGEIPANQTIADEDLDSLPDSWEKIYDAESCALSYASPDTDQNGLSDAEEDYDQDGASNYEEYLAKTDPCLADDNPGSWKVQDNPWGKGKNLTTGELPKPLQPPVLPPVGEGEVLPLILLLIGIVMMMGGTGYLVYYYQYSPESKMKMTASKAGGGVSVPSGRLSSLPQKKPALNTAQELSLRRQRLLKSKSRMRTSVFGEFGGKTEGAGLGVLAGDKEKASQKAKDFVVGGEETDKKVLGKEVKKKADDQEEKPVELNNQEPSSEKKESLFSQLKGLAKKTDGKSLQDLANSPKEKSKDDVFGKLKDLGKKKKR